MVKTVIKFCISFISYLILSFIIVYSILLFNMRSKNAALIFSIYLSVVISVSLLLIQNIFSLKRQKKIHRSELEKNQYQNLLELDDQSFIKYLIDSFKINNILYTDSSCIIAESEVYFFIRQYSKITKDQILQICRIKNINKDKKCTCVLLCPYQDDDENTLKSKCINIIPKQEILKLANKAYDENEQDVIPQNTNKSQKFRKLLLNKNTSKYCIKYSMSFIFISLFSYNKTWYFLASALLMILCLSSLIFRRKHQSSTMV